MFEMTQQLTLLGVAAVSRKKNLNTLLTATRDLRRLDKKDIVCYYHYRCLNDRLYVPPTANVYRHCLVALFSLNLFCAVLKWRRRHNDGHRQTFGLAGDLCRTLAHLDRLPTTIEM